jgi:hypothetical protein
VTELALALLAQLGAGVGGPGRVTVESNTTCPAAAEVEARLAALLPPLADGAAPERAAIAVDGDAVRVRLVGADGAALGERTLTLSAACADRANVVAVVIAAWEAQRGREDVQAPAFARPPTTAPTVVVAAPSPSPPPPALAFELAAGPALTFVDGGVSPAGALALSAWGRHLGARLGLLGFWPLTDGLGAGRARWSRVGASLELGGRARTRAGRLDVHGGPVAAVLLAAGTGFDVDQTTSGLSPGLTAGADWSYALGRAFVGVGGNVVGWTAQRLVSSSATPDVRPLPRAQASLDAHVGVAF